MCKYTVTIVYLPLFGQAMETVALPVLFPSDDYVMRFVTAMFRNPDVSSITVEKG